MPNQLQQNAECDTTHWSEYFVAKAWFWQPAGNNKLGELSLKLLVEQHRSINSAQNSQ